MPVSEIEPGMEGIGKTVFHGTKIEDFKVEIIDIISGDYNIKEFILAKLNGTQLKKFGGISAGMSGSPVYIEGQLIGAISHTWELSEHNLCLITPIEEMLLLLEFPYEDTKSSPGSYKRENFYAIKNNNNWNEIKFESQISPYINPLLSHYFKRAKNMDVFNAIAMPIIINGLNGRSFNNLGSAMERLNLKVIQGINGVYHSKMQEVGEDLDYQLEPGSAIGIQLTRGDVNISSIGTVTYRQGNKILALGHPFLRRGEADYFLSSVYIYHSLPNIVMPFKIGAPLKLVGHISQDREAGIVGVLNTFPRIIPLKITVNNLDSDINYQMGMQLLNDNYLLEPFISNFTVQAIDNAMDSIGKGSAEVDIEISGMKKDHKIFRKNMYCSMNDIAVDTIKELPEIIGLVTGNYFEKINLIGINIYISITDTIKCGRIEEVKLNKKTYAPGETLEANVKIRTFRKGVIDKKIILEIPSSMPESEAVLTIRGGGEADQFSEEDEQIYHHENASNLKEAIENISDRPLNNQLVAEILLYRNDALLNGDSTQNDLESEDKINSQIRIDTKMVIQGYKEIPFSIIP